MLTNVLDSEKRLNSLHVIGSDALKGVTYGLVLLGILGSLGQPQTDSLPPLERVTTEGDRLILSRITNPNGEFEIVAGRQCLVDGNAAGGNYIADLSLDYGDDFVSVASGVDGLKTIEPVEAYVVYSDEVTGFGSVGISRNVPLPIVLAIAGKTSEGEVVITWKSNRIPLLNPTDVLKASPVTQDKVDYSAGCEPIE